MHSRKCMSRAASLPEVTIYCFGVEDLTDLQSTTESIIGTMARLAATPQDDPIPDVPYLCLAFKGAEIGP